MKLALDAMGGDSAPASVVQGVLSALPHTPDSYSFILVGDENRIRQEFNGSVPDRISIHHTSQIVEMTDRGATVLKAKPDSSIVQGIRLVKDQQADGFISAGHTGAVLTASLLLLGRIQGVKRPALGAYIPTPVGGKVLCDVGANPDAKPLHMLQFALMSMDYIVRIEGVSQPKIGLVNIGEEPTKGSELYQETHQLFQEKLPNFIGNVEGRHLMDCAADILICDGFVGNTLLKFAEAWITILGQEIKSRSLANLRTKLGALFLKPVFKDLQKQYDYEEHGGTPLLGVNGISIVCHGSSGPKSIKNSIAVAKKCIDNKLIAQTEHRLADYQGIPT
ncbi:MAG: phosphate acyltransferase PlsX [Candidatus Neomarinimicrobiota bacterium]|nr:MAG: phosphate acyltransferase PlsX [Candidatus Neomarinimicrobiota bacterium]